MVPFFVVREARGWCALILFDFVIVAVDLRVGFASNNSFSSSCRCRTRLEPRFALTACREEEEYESSEGYDDEEDDEDDEDEEAEVVERKSIISIRQISTDNL